MYHTWAKISLFDSLGPGKLIYPFWHLMICNWGRLETGCVMKQRCLIHNLTWILIIGTISVLRSYVSWDKFNTISVIWKLIYAVNPTDPSHNYCNAPDKYPTTHYFVTEMWAGVHISVTKWCIMGIAASLWDFYDRSVKHAPVSVVFSFVEVFS